MKKTIRLTESDLHRIIESAINELSPEGYAKMIRGVEKMRGSDDPYKAARARHINDKYFEGDDNPYGKQMMRNIAKYNNPQYQDGDEDFIWRGGVSDRNPYDGATNGREFKTRRNMINNMERANNAYETYESRHYDFVNQITESVMRKLRY